jgi:hypothetical protein
VGTAFPWRCPHWLATTIKARGKSSKPSTKSSRLAARKSCQGLSTIPGVSNASCSLLWSVLPVALFGEASSSSRVYFPSKTSTALWPPLQPEGALDFSCKPITQFLGRILALRLIFVRTLPLYLSRCRRHSSVRWSSSMISDSGPTRPASRSATTSRHILLVRWMRCVARTESSSAS